MIYKYSWRIASVAAELKLHNFSRKIEWERMILGKIAQVIMVQMEK